jgi:hypothetical protein
LGKLNGELLAGGILETVYELSVNGKFLSMGAL